MEKLVDTAVSLVEEGKLQQAIEVLQQGIQLLSTTFPNRYEFNMCHACSSTQLAVVLKLQQVEIRSCRTCTSGC